MTEGEEKTHLLSNCKTNQHSDKLRDSLKMDLLNLLTEVTHRGADFVQWVPKPFSQCPAERSPECSVAFFSVRENQRIFFEFSWLSPKRSGWLHQKNKKNLNYLKYIRCIRNNWSSEFYAWKFERTLWSWSWATFVATTFVSAKVPKEPSLLWQLLQIQGRPVFWHPGGLRNARNQMDFTNFHLATSIDKQSVKLMELRFATNLVTVHFQTSIKFCTKQKVYMA